MKIKVSNTTRSPFRVKMWDQWCYIEHEQLEPGLTETRYVNAKGDVVFGTYHRVCINTLARSKRNA